MAKRLEKLFLVILCILLVPVLITVLFNKINIDLFGTRKLVIVSLIFIVVLLFGLSKIYKIWDRVKISEVKFLICITILYFILLICFALYFMQDGYAETSWVYEGANILANGGSILGDGYYEIKFAQFQYLSGILFVAVFFEKIAVFFHLNERIFLVVINCILTSTVLPSSYYICKKIFSKRAAWYSVIILFCYIPIYFTSCIFYNYTFILAFPVGILALYVSMMEKDNVCIKQIIAIGFLTGLGYCIFNVCAVVAIAVFIELFLLRNKKKIALLIGLTSIVFSIVFSIYFNSQYYTYIYNEGIYNENKYPMLESTVYVGLNKDTYGRFSVEDEDFIKSYDSYQSKKAALRSQIKERWNGMSNGDKVKFLMNKTAVNFGNGTYYTEWTSNDNLWKQRKIIRFFSKDYDDVKYYRSFFGAANLLFLLGVCVTSIWGIRNRYATLVPWISIFGIMIVSLISETNPRHILDYLSFLIVIFANFCDILYERLERKMK